MFEIKRGDGEMRGYTGDRASGVGVAKTQERRELVSVLAVSQMNGNEAEEW